MNIRFRVDSDYLLSRYGPTQPKSLPLEGIVAFCLAGATDGKHRDIAFEYSSYDRFDDANAILQHVLEVSVTQFID